MSCILPTISDCVQPDGGLFRPKTAAFSEIILLC